MIAQEKEDNLMKEKDQNQGWRNFKGDSIGAVVDLKKCENLVPATEQIKQQHCDMGDGIEGDCPIFLGKSDYCQYNTENRGKRRKAPKKGTKCPWYQRIARMLVIMIGIFVVIITITIWSTIRYSDSRNTPLLFSSGRLALHKGSIYTRDRESIIIADDGKGFVEMVYYLSLDSQGLITTRALGTNRYFAFAWIPKPPYFEGANSMIDYNCDGQYTPMGLGGEMIIPGCFIKILTDKMINISPSRSSTKSDIVL